jgi:hypothetical protein
MFGWRLVYRYLTACSCRRLPVKTNKQYAVEIIVCFESWMPVAVAISVFFFLKSKNDHFFSICLLTIIGVCCWWPLRPHRRPEHVAATRSRSAQTSGRPNSGVSGWAKLPIQTDGLRKLNVYLHSKLFLCCAPPTNIVRHQLWLILSGVESVIRRHKVSYDTKLNLSCKYPFKFVPETTKTQLS